MEDLAVVPRDSLPPTYGERGYVSEPNLTFRGRPGLALAMAVCRTQDEEGVWHGLAELLRRVPEEYVAAAVRLSDRMEVQIVQCPCGAPQMAGNGLVECAGGCSRWYVADESGVWAMRLPEQET